MTVKSHEPTQPSSALLVGADWALAHNDMGALAYTSRLLAARTSKSLGEDLMEMADLCERDGDLAARRWPMLRTEICAELKIGGASDFARRARD